MPNTFLIQISDQGHKNLTQNHKIENSSWERKKRCRDQGNVEQGDTVLFYCTSKVRQHSMSLALSAPVESVSSDKTVIRFGNIHRIPSPISRDRIWELVDKGQLEEAFGWCSRWQGIFVKRLQPASLSLVWQLTKAGERPTARGKSAGTQERTIPLAEDAYFRETGPRKQKILRLHNALSNSFERWLEVNGYSQVRQEVRKETGWADVEFIDLDELCRAELKVCHAVGTTKAIREALGQLLEYNYFRNSEPAKRWFIILDQRPSSDDQRYIDKLRSELDLPLVLG